MITASGKYTEGEGYNLDSFVADFLGSFTCNSLGTSEPAFKEGWSWSILADKFDDLTSKEKLELKQYSADQYGNDEARCVARYDYIVRKYGEAKYSNFMERNIPQVNHSIGILNTEDTTNYMTIIIVVISLSGLIGCFFCLKKRYK